MVLKKIVTNHLTMDNKQLPTIFKLLSDEELKMLQENCFEVSFRTGEIIFKQGGAFTHIIFLTKGKAKVLLEDSNRQSILLKILCPYDITGGPGFNTDYRHYYSLIALEETKAIFIDIPLFRKFFISNPDFALELITFLNHGFIGLYDKIRTINNKHMRGRLADTLLYLSEKIYKQDEFTTELTRSEIANMSGMTKESIIRTLKSFKEDKIIDCQGNSFKILKKEVLLAITEKG